MEYTRAELINYPKRVTLDCGKDDPNEVISESFSNKHYLCRCRQVAEKEIDCLIKSGNCNSLEQVEGKTNAGSGCGACRIRIKNLLKVAEEDKKNIFSYCEKCCSISALCVCSYSKAISC